MTIVTLLTDFGLNDEYAGMLKGILWSIAPTCQIVDLTHQIPPQDVLQAALMLGRTTSYFPAGSIHLAVVDPGVGTSRRPIAAQLGEQYFVGPDNGLFTLPLLAAQEMGATIQIVHLNQPAFWLPTLSASFHGRDLFAPVAAHLANGVSLAQLGTPIHDPQCLNLPTPESISNGWRAHILHCDHFGNLATDLTRDQTGNVPLHIIAAGQIIPFVKTFGDGQPGQLIALFDSSDRLTLAVVNGNASQRLNISIGSTIEVYRN
jgi:S-adenosylmethionine hydrolase